MKSVYVFCYGYYYHVRPTAPQHHTPTKTISGPFRSLRDDGTWSEWNRPGAFAGYRRLRYKPVAINGIIYEKLYTVYASTEFYHSTIRTDIFNLCLDDGNYIIISNNAKLDNWPHKYTTDSLVKLKRIPKTVRDVAAISIKDRHVIYN